MSVRLAALGLLAEREGHAYDVISRFNERIPSWDVNSGQLYQEILKLEKLGLVEPVLEAIDTGNNRRGPVFRPTQKGQDELDRWFETRSERVRPLRDDLFVKIALCRPSDIPSLLQSIGTQKRLCHNRLDEYTRIRAVLTSSAQTELEHARRAILLDGAIAHLQAEIEWLREASLRLRSALDTSVSS